MPKLKQPHPLLQSKKQTDLPSKSLMLRRQQTSRNNLSKKLPKKRKEQRKRQKSKDKKLLRSNWKKLNLNRSKKNSRQNCSKNKML